MSYYTPQTVTISVPAGQASGCNMPMTPEQELAFVEGLPGGPYYLNQCIADECIAKYGRIPNNFRVLKRITLMPSVPPIEQLLDWVRSIGELPAPVVADDGLAPRGAQWKREIQGRRR